MVYGSTAFGSGGGDLRVVATLEGAASLEASAETQAGVRTAPGFSHALGEPFRSEDRVDDHDYPAFAVLSAKATLALNISFEGEAALFGHASIEAIRSQEAKASLGASAELAVASVYREKSYWQLLWERRPEWYWRLQQDSITTATWGLWDSGPFGDNSISGPRAAQATGNNGDRTFVLNEHPNPHSALGAWRLHGNTFRTRYNQNAGTYESLSVGCWVKTDEEGGNAVNLWDWDNGSVRIFKMQLAGTTRRARFTRWMGGTAYTIEGTTSINDGEWHFVVAVAGDEEISLYVDGVLEDQAPVSGSHPTGNTIFYFGTSGTGSDDIYRGLVTDLFLLRNDELRSATVAEMYRRMVAGPSMWATWIDETHENLGLHEDPIPADTFNPVRSRQSRYLGEATWLRRDASERPPQDIESGKVLLEGKSSLRMLFDEFWDDFFKDGVVSADEWNQELWNPHPVLSRQYIENQEGVLWYRSGSKWTDSRQKPMRDVEVLTHFRVETGSTNTNWWHCLFIRGDGARTTGNTELPRSGYWVEFRANLPWIQVRGRPSGTGTAISSMTEQKDIGFEKGVNWSMRWRAVGTTHRVKVWRREDPEPFEWTFEFEDDIALEPGNIGFAGNHSNTNNAHRVNVFTDYISVIDPTQWGQAFLEGRAELRAVPGEDGVEFGDAVLSGGATLSAIGERARVGVVSMVGRSRAYSHEGETHPGTIEGLGGWFMANLATALGNGDRVEYLDDDSGLGRHFYQASLGARPALVHDQLNGYPVLRFDGPNQHIRQEAHAVVSQPRTYFFVLRTQGDYLMDGAQSTSNRHYIRILSSGGRVRITAGSWQEVFVDHNIGNDYRILAVTFDGSNSLVDVNGVFHSISGDIGNQGAAGIGLGATVGGVNGITGDIAEAIVFDRRLGESEYTSVAGYLASKYAVEYRVRAHLHGEGALYATGVTVSVGEAHLETDSRLQSEHDYGTKPSELDGLEVWLSSSDLYMQWLNDDDRVAEWVGAASRATQNINSLRPRLRRGVAAGGRDVVRFSGSHALRTSQLEDPSAQPNTTLVVTSMGGPGQYVLDGVDAFNRHTLQVSSAGNVVASSGGSDRVESHQSTPVGIELWSITFGYEGQGTTIRRRGAPHQRRTISNNGWRGYTVGAHNNGLSGYLNGDVLEVIHFNRELSDEELALMEGYLSRKHSLPLGGSSILQGQATVHARPAGEYLDGTSSLMAVGSVERQVSADIDGSSEVIALLGTTIHVESGNIDGESVVEAGLDVHGLSGGSVEGSSEVEAHLGWVDDIARLVPEESRGEAGGEGTVTGTFRAQVDTIEGSSEVEANLSYLQLIEEPSYAHGESVVEGQFEVHLLSGGEIDCSSEIEADLGGEYLWRGQADGSSSMEIIAGPFIETFFFPGEIHGLTTMVGGQFRLAPHDLLVDRINGRTSFRSDGVYLTLRLERELAARIAGETSFVRAILGMPIIIGRFQADRAEGSSEVRANLFLNEGGQANGNSRMSVQMHLLHDRYMEAITTGTQQASYDIVLPQDQYDYWRPQVTQHVLDRIAESFGAASAVLQMPSGGPRIRISRGHIPCGSAFLWADLWRRGVLEAQVAECWAGVGKFYEGGRNVHPYRPSDDQKSGQDVSWNRPEGYFVDWRNLNVLGLRAQTSTEDDQYTMPRTWPSWHPNWRSTGSNATPYGSQITSDINAGRLWHEPMVDDHPDFFHGRCGARFHSTINGTNSVDMYVELKNALYALIHGHASATVSFIVLRYRTMTVLGNLARKADLGTSVSGIVGKSDRSRTPAGRRPAGQPHETRVVRGGKTLYT